jgi:hypothetical protein
MQLEPDKKIGMNAFEYPNEYPKRMTDWGMYAIFCLQTWPQGVGNISISTLILGVK